jgi:maltose alpha-D-glucosyltransferase/alpha-amylase
LLYTGKDFIVTDFEGDIDRPLSERRGKHSALRDVAAMIRSFHYASHAAMAVQAQGASPAGSLALEPWRRLWQAWVGVNFVRGYLDTARKAAFVPRDPEELRVLLEISLLEESLYELNHALEHQRDLVRVPLEGILQLVRPAEPKTIAVHGTAASRAT